ncbi:MAG: hypothetical protein DRI39_08465 [Chloroflexi bacterium]|nr:MAG: hypothetical protein DRI39_08465 [Chloroflexota bacterium]RLC95706.1 MAG: hypothetical protein DRI40_05210 [Chloroflexota bacterium]
MPRQRQARTLRLRPHHICCLPFLSFDGATLDERFRQVLTEVKEMLTAQPNVLVTAIEGVDEVCQACPSCINDRCESPPIKEDMVRKVDRFLLRDLRKSYGETLTVAEWQSVISQKWPYRLCRICRWREYCGIQVV